MNERILGCLKGIATGDAIGKQTETLSRDGVLRWYPDGIRGFEGPAGTPIPRYVGNAKREWRIGETTDDTEGTIAVARAILQQGSVHHASVGSELLKCTKSVHPGVKSLWEFHQAGDPARVTERHDGCGAAIRVAPVGILYGSHRLDDVVAAAREASISTHGGSAGNRGRCGYRSRCIRGDRRSITARDHRARTACGSSGRTRTVTLSDGHFRRSCSHRPQ